MYNDKFRDDSKLFKFISAIECRVIDAAFNRDYNFHGPPGVGTAFIFHVTWSNGEQEALHYCLGFNRNCDSSCKDGHFSM